MIAIRNYYSTGDLLWKRAPRYSLLGGSMYNERKVKIGRLCGARVRYNEIARLLMCSF